MMIEALDVSEDDDGGWNLEGSGNPSVSLFSSALQVWAACQEESVTVDAAALAFNVRPELIRQAIDHHPWMYLSGDVIEHEGE